MPKKDFTLTSKILMTLLAAGDLLLVSPQELKKRLSRGNIFSDGKDVAAIAYYLSKKGLIKYVDKNNRRFIKLTRNGQLEALLAKTRLPMAQQKWDGKWRVIIFDIPEESRDKRDMFRLLLKRNNFIRLQGSVFISPYPLSREALQYLRQSGLIDYIRIFKVEEMDDDRDLKKKFLLK